MRSDEPTIKTVQAIMRRINAQTVHDALDAEQAKKQAVDPTAGIFIAPLVKIPPVLIYGQAYHFHGARVLGKYAGQPYVSPHLHLFGGEPYLFLDGRGEMNIGYLVDEGTAVMWKHPVEVSAGDQWVIDGGEVHSFRNLGESPVDFIFACPLSHVEDRKPGHTTGDRYVVKDLRNGIPPHFLVT